MRQPSAAPNDECKGAPEDVILRCPLRVGVSVRANAPTRLNTKAPKLKVWFHRRRQKIRGGEKTTRPQAENGLGGTQRTVPARWRLPVTPRADNGALEIGTVGPRPVARLHPHRVVVAHAPARTPRHGIAVVGPAIVPAGAPEDIDRGGIVIVVRLSISIVRPIVGIGVDRGCHVDRRRWSIAVADRTVMRGAVVTR